MHVDIKDGFVNLAKEREKLIQVLNDKGDISTKGLEFWTFFNTSCVIAESYHSDVRKKLKLEMAAGYLNDAKKEMGQSISHDDFQDVENALKDVINTISKLAIEKFKYSVSELRDGVLGSAPPTLNK